MNNENFHPVLQVPPLAHALHRWNKETKTLTYEYNGIDIIKVRIPESKDPGFRHGSDGTMQSTQYTQQIYLSVERPMWVTLEFQLSNEATLMRPKRASSEEAIIGQLGNVLADGVNGLYDRQQDLLISFHGVEWYWETHSFLCVNDRKIARVCFRLSEKPLFINLFMLYYKNHLGYSCYEPWKSGFNRKAVSGWCSWEAYRRNIDIEKITQISDFMEKNLKKYGLEYIQVDDGYQKMPLPYDASKNMAEGWLSCEESRFPGGHKEIIETIKARGFSPAIWTNANITNDDFPRYHAKDVLFHDNKPMKGEWIDFLYSCTPETLAKQVHPVFEGYRSTGYNYVKIDAIRHLLYDGLHEAVRLGIMSNQDAQDRFRAYLAATRDGLGKDVYYLASWGGMNEVIGIADACRISMDANPTWAGIHMQMFEMARWFHTQRILFLNDPDHVCVRTKLDWAKSILSLICLSGGLYMLSDTTDAYTEEKLSVIKKTLPPLETQTAETGPLNMDFPAYTWTKLHGFAVQSHDTPVEAEGISLKDVYDMAGIYPTMNDNHPFSTLWAFHVNHSDMAWCVLGRFATIPLRSCTIPMHSLGLDNNKVYHAFDFWKESYMGVVRSEISCRELQVGQCQIVSLREVQDVPQFLASSRHVSMDAASVTKTCFENYCFLFELSCVPQTTENYYLYVPDKFNFANADSSEAEVKAELDDRLLKVAVSALSQRVSVHVHFTLKNGEEE